MFGHVWHIYIKERRFRSAGHAWHVLRNGPGRALVRIQRGNAPLVGPHPYRTRSSLALAGSTQPNSPDSCAHSSARLSPHWKVCTQGQGWHSSASCWWVPLRGIRRDWARPQSQRDLATGLARVASLDGGTWRPSCFRKSGPDSSDLTWSDFNGASRAFA